jgi:transposase
MEVLMKVPVDVLAVGIDPGKKVHYGVALAYPEVKLTSQTIPNDYSAIVKFDGQVMEIAKRYNLRVLYGLEDSGAYGRPLKEILLSFGRKLVEVNPLKTNRQKDFYGKGKSDEIDATSIAAVILRSYSTLPKIEATDQLLEAIREAERFRESLVKNKTQNLNRLHFQLTRVYLNAYKTFFSRLDSKGALAFFATFPIPQMLKEVSLKTLSSFLLKASDYRLGRGKNLEVAQTKARLIMDSTRFIKEQPITLEKMLKAEIIRQLALNLTQNIESIQKVERMLKSQLLPKTGQKLQSLKGIKTAIASVILGETLNPDRFRTKDQFALYNGTAPKEKSSGGKVQHIANKGCNRRLKRAFYQIALTASQHDPLSYAYYQSLIARGLPKREALKRLARRLSDIVFAMLKRKRAYDSTIAQTSIRQRDKRWSVLPLNEKRVGWQYHLTRGQSPKMI